MNPRYQCGRLLDVCQVKVSWYPASVVPRSCQIVLLKSPNTVVLHFCHIVQSIIITNSHMGNSGLYMTTYDICDFEEKPPAAEKTDFWQNQSKSIISIDLRLVKTVSYLIIYFQTICEHHIYIFYVVTRQMLFFFISILLHKHEITLTHFFYSGSHKQISETPDKGCDSKEMIVLCWQ